MIVAVSIIGGFVVNAGAAWPERSIQYIVPYKPGGGADASARVFCNGLSKKLGVAVVVVNVPGVSATRGLARVAEAKPDGYTMGAFHEGLQATFVNGVSKYNLGSLQCVCNVYRYPNLFLTRIDAPWNNLAELNKAAKEKPGAIKVASVLGGSTHMFVQQYMNSAGVKFNPVPYNGHSERLNAILGGFVDLTELPPSVASSMLRAKKLKALCMLSEEREPDFPDLPTAIEEGVDVEYSSHYALYLPKDTPSEIVIKLVKVCQETLKDPKVVVGLKKIGRAHV